MEFWFSEPHTPNVKLSIRVDRQLYSGKSEFQRIDVFDSPEFGRFLTLDGYMMLTEKDALKPDLLARTLAARAAVDMPEMRIHRSCLLGRNDAGELVPLMEL